MSTLELIKRLREESGAGMSECKKAVEAANGNYEAAFDWLRTNAKSKVAKNAARIAAEGLVGVSVKGLQGAIIEVNSQTDFVAQNEIFKQIVSNGASNALQVSDVEALKKTKIGAETIEEFIANATLSIGEKIDLRRMFKVEVSKGLVSHYVHNAVEGSPNLGKIAVLVALKSEASAEKLAELGKQICMHIAASTTKYLNVKDVPETEISREKKILLEQVSDVKKPQAVIDKMIEGRMEKFYAEVVLLEQIFIMDTSMKIKDLIAKASKEIGTSVEIESFAKVIVGEGIEKQETDFAKEVAEMSK
jgi:elongation factor Ts